MNFEGKSILELSSSNDPQTTINKDDIAANALLIADNTTNITTNTANILINANGISDVKQYAYIELYPLSTTVATNATTIIFANNNHNPIYSENTGYIGGSNGILQFSASSQFEPLKSVPTNPTYGILWNRPASNPLFATFHVKGRIAWDGNFPFQLNNIGLRVVAFTGLGFEGYNNLYNPRNQTTNIPIGYYEIDTVIVLNVDFIQKLQFYMTASTNISDFPLTYIVGGDADTPTKSVNSLYVKRIS